MRILSLILIPLLCAPAYAGNGATRFAVAASDALSTSTSCEISGNISGTDSASKQITPGAYLGRLELTLTSIVTAASVTVWLAQSSDGENAITDQVSETIVDDDSDGNGTANVLINTGWIASGVGSDVYVCAKTDAGTATSVGRVFFEVR